jgi:hypothetical protein
MRDRASQLAAEMQGHARKLEVATERHEELLDMIALLTRKPRARKPRAVAEAPANDAAEEAAVEARPSVFAASVAEEAA